MQASAGNLKKVQLELGGKGPNIVFDDANLVAAVNGSAWAIFHNQGQACIAGSRLILHEKIADAFLDKFIALAKSIRLGNPLDAATEMGPLTSKQHRDRVLHYVERGARGRRRGADRRQGARTARWPRAATSSRPSCARRPRETASRRKKCSARSSPCSPSDDDEALAIANGVKYGLGSGLWTTNLSRAHRLAREINAGMVWINCYKVVNPGSPFGGVGRAAMAARWGSRPCANTRGQNRVGQCRRADAAVVPPLR